MASLGIISVECVGVGDLDGRKFGVLISVMKYNMTDIHQSRNTVFMISPQKRPYFSCGHGDDHTSSFRIREIAQCFFYGIEPWKIKWKAFFSAKALD